MADVTQSGAGAAGCSCCQSKELRGARGQSAPQEKGDTFTTLPTPLTYNQQSKVVKDKHQGNYFTTFLNYANYRQNGQGWYVYSLFLLAVIGGGAAAVEVQ